MYRTLIWTTCINVHVRLWRISRDAAVMRGTIVWIHCNYREIGRGF